MRLEPLEDRRLLSVFDVNSALDTVDANVGDGLAEDASGTTTLRAAIMEANASSDADTINLPAGTYNLTLAGFGEDATATGDLDITQSVDIVGADAAATIIDATAVGDRIFDLLDYATVNISGVTITGGQAQLTGSLTSESYGGGIRADFNVNWTLTDSILTGNAAPDMDGTSRWGIGGAISSTAQSMVIDNCSLFDNMASNDSGAIRTGGPGVVTIRQSTISDNFGFGGSGAIKVGSGTMTIEDSTISGNTANGTGGAIENSGTLNVINSTISGNSGSFAGAIMNNGTLSVNGSTIFGNSGPSGGGGIYSAGTSLQIENSIVAGNAARRGGPDVYGTVTSLGYNIIGDSTDSVGFGATGDQLDVDPLLGPLADNGGPTLTHALLTDSPAIDGANTTTASAADQRGIARPVGAAADVGAYEKEPGAAIAGTKFNDLDGNGMQDTGESGLADWTIYLDENGNGQLDTDLGGYADYVSTDVPVTIDGTEIHLSTITVPEGVGAIQDVNVTLDITHTQDLQIDAVLMHPDGTRLTLFGGVGSIYDDFTDTTLDDEASTPITSGSAPFSGSYQPMSPLSRFDGKDAAGVWTLMIRDGSWTSQDGTLNSWSLGIDSGPFSEPTALTDSNGDYAFSDLPAGTYTVAESPQLGWDQTAPASGTYTVTVEAGDEVPSLDFGDMEMETETSTLSPSADGYATDENQDGTFTALDTTSAAFWTSYFPSGSFTNPSEERGLLEFDLSSFSASATVVSATLELEPIQLTAGVYPTIHVYAYEGDGAITLADATVAGVEQDSATIETFDTVSFSIDPAYVQGLLGTETDLGLMTRQLVGNGSFVQFTSSEYGLAGYQPRLILETIGGGEIRGSKWSDSDGDGVWDAEESPLAGWEIYLDLNENGQYDSGEPLETTDANGEYVFTDVAPGDYVVAEAMQTDWDQTYPGEVAPPPVSEFQIDIEFTAGDFTTSQEQVFLDAAARWSEIIIGDLPEMTTSAGLVDDILIQANATNIDGVGGVLGQAGPTEVRSGTYLPALGTMQFDSADIAAIETAGQLDEVILHEMAHVLGFGTIWSYVGLLSGEGTTDPRFTGKAATAEYNTIFGLSETSVPVENTGGTGTQDAHWRETTFDNELMTGWLNSGEANPLSRITAAQFEDMGYEVYLDAADAYSPPSSAPLASVQLGGEEWGKILTLDAAPVVLPQNASAGDGLANETPLAATNPGISYTHWVNVGIGEVVDGVNFGNHQQSTALDYGDAPAPYPTVDPASPSGELDSTFGTDGLVITDFGGKYDDIEGMTLDSDGKILAVGTGGSSNRFAIARYLPDGSLDTSFSGDGKLIITDDSAGSPAVQSLSDGKILVGIPALVYSPGFRVFRLNNDGSYDSSFGVGGEAGVATGGSQVNVEDMAVQPDGKIIVGGYDFYGSNWDFVLTRFNADGSVDTTFGVGGVVRTDFDRTEITNPIDHIYDILLLPDGKIVAGGFTSTTSAMSTGNRIYAMARYLPDGSLDTSFDDDGMSVFTFTTSGSQMEAISDMLLLEDGTILAASSGGSDTALLRILPDGSVDTSFATAGRVVAPSGAAYANLGQILPDGLGGILGAGGGFAVTRLFLDGTVDTTFGTDGTAAADFGQTIQGAGSLAVQADGKIVAGGVSGEPNINYDWSMARFDGPALAAAKHAIVAGLYLGAGVDGDSDGQPDADALGDDNDGSDDEDGVLFTSPLVPGEIATLDVTASAAGLLNAWVDFNDDGDWADAGEQVFADQPLSAGVNGLSFTVPATSAATSQTFARFRFSTAAGLSYAGEAPNGEVEDYAVAIEEGLGVIQGVKWNDLDGDGMHDAEEPGLAGWQIYIDANSNDQWDDGEAIAATDADGLYTLSGLEPGTYTVAEVQQTGWTQIFPASPGTHSVVVTEGTAVTGIDFGNRALPGEIHGSKWNDLDGDGTWDTGEPVLAGWDIYLDVNENEQWDTGEPITTTVADGTYSFTDLAPGVYTVREVNQTGWEQTSPGNVGTVNTFVSIDNDPEGDAPRALAYTLDGQYVLVVNRDTDNVTVLNAATRALVATVPVGDNPRSIAVSSTYAVVANLNSNSVSVIALSSWTVAATVPVTGTEPYRVQVSDDGTAAIVGVINDPGGGTPSSFSVIDLTGTPTETRTFDTTPQGVISLWSTTETRDYGYEYSQFALSSDNQTLVLAYRSGSQIMVYDWTTGSEIAALASEDSPTAVDISDDGTLAVVSHELSSTNDVSVVDLSGTTPTITASYDITTDSISNHVVRITPDKSHAVVSTYNDVFFVDLSTGDTTATFYAATIFDMAITYDGSYLLVAGYEPEVVDLSSFTVVKTFYDVFSHIAAASPTDYRVVCVDAHAAETVHFFNANGASGSLEGSVPTGGVPEGDAPRYLAVSADGSIATTGNTTSQNVSIIDLATQTVRAYVDTGDRVQSVAITPDGSTAVVANMESNTVSIIDLSTDTLVKTLNTYFRPSEIVISPDSQWAYVTCVSGTDQVYFIALDGASSSISGTLTSGDYGSFTAYDFTMSSGLALSADGSILAACSSFTDELILIDTATQSEIVAVSIGSGTYPIQAAFSPDGVKAYVLNYGTDTVSVVSVEGTSSAVVATITGMDEPATVNVDAAGAFVYVGNNGSTTPGVQVIDTSTNTVVQSISLPNGGAPRSAYLSDTNSILYLTGPRTTGTGSVYRVDAQGASSSLIDEVLLDGAVMSLGFSESLNTAVVTEPLADGVAVVAYSNFVAYGHVVEVGPGEVVEDVDFGNYTEVTNAPPTVELTGTTTSLAEDTDTTSRVKVADIVVTDDALGTNVLSLTGDDAALFEIDGTELYLLAGTTLDFETNPVLDVTVEVDDASLGTGAEDSDALAITITDVNEAPTVELTGTTTSLAEDTDTTSRVKVADIVVTDDGLGTNDLSLSGDDAALFEVAGAELYLIAGVTLDFETNRILDVTVEVDDITIGASPDDSAALAISITDVDELDFGDAPLPYATTLAQDGARHTPDGPTLGSERDSEYDGVASTGADADDTDGAVDDEDGVTIVAIQVGQLGASVTVNVQNASSGAMLDAWIDFNGDGSWGGPMEQIAHSVSVVEGDNILIFDVPSWAVQGETYARFRLSTDGGLAPTGAADDGEVEDCLVTIMSPEKTSGVFSSAQVLAEACSNPSDIRIVDMDGDGDMDLLAAAAGSQRIVWYENDGDEYFSSHLICAWAYQVQSVMAVDVDGDGDMDVLSAMWQYDRIVWFENDGDQNFTPTMLSTTADGAQCVFAADVDGDGDVDVLSASYNDDTIAWYENDGGSFTSHTITTLANGAISVFAEDVDGDGDMDVFSASELDDTIAWYENDGFENFLIHEISTTADAARSVFASDLDEDGDIDVIAASSGDDTIAWYENDGFENFTAHAISTTADGARMVYVEDLDGDGNLDVLSASVDDDTVSWYENDGFENFTARVVSAEVDGARSVFASDLDGDGDLDVVAASSNDARVAWYENDGAESFALHTVMTPADGARAVFAADMDGDGDMDVLSAAQYDNEIAWHENDGSENFVPHTITTAAIGASTVFAADVDGDGDLDALSASSQGDTIAWYENDGSGVFTTHTITSSADGAISVVAADVDGDGDLDVLSASYSDDVIAWYENDGSQAFTAHTISTSADGPMSVFAADVDGDGDMDALSASSYDGKIAWYENDGAGKFTACTIATSVDSAYSVFATDVDGDGDMDVLSASLGEDMIAWYENDGSQSFTAHAITTSAIDAVSVFAADMDGDGDVDVLSAALNGNKIHWYENDGAENFTAWTITAEASAANCVFAADVDGDGDLDVLSSSFADDKIAWYENLAYDYGDAPGPYPTLAADDGAYHAPTGPVLGKTRDDEQDGQPTSDAEGDDATGIPDDEDGIVGQSVLARGESVYLDVQVSAASYLNLWIDFNGDGDWNDSGEHITETDIAMAAGVNHISFRVPTDAVLGLTYARLRLTSYDTGGSLTPTGAADDGEVEDYSLTVGDVLYLYGNDAVNDVIAVWPGAPGGAFHEVSINGEVATYDAAIYNVIRINALDGSDRITIHGTDAAEQASLEPGSVFVTSSSYAVYGASVETMSVDGGGGADEVTLIGSSGSNRLYSYADSSRMSDSPRTYSHRADGFETVTVDGSVGTGNYAFFYDSPENDVLSASPEGVELSREDGTTTRSARGFDRVYVYATSGGDDSAELTGADGARNRLYSFADYTTFTESARTFYFYVRGFGAVAVDSPGTAATYAYIYDSPDSDSFEATPTSAAMDRAESYSDLTTTGFSRVYAYSTRGGDDAAMLTGSDGGGNRYRGYPTFSTLTDAASSFYHYARGFESLAAIGSSSDLSGDRAYLFDSSGDDTLTAAFLEDDVYQGASLSDTAGSYANSVAYFDLVYARSSDSGATDTIDVDEELLAYELIRLGTW